MHRSHIRENLSFDCTTLQWRAEDIARSTFRLSVLQKAQNRPTEAANLRKEAIGILKELDGEDISIDESEFSDEQLMEVFDNNVALWHGRTTGVWSDGIHW